MKTIAVVLPGPPGAGKSSVLEKLATLLEIEGLQFGALRLEGSILRRVVAFAVLVLPRPQAPVCA